jgi:integrase/recombinase XerD
MAGINDEHLSGFLDHVRRMKSDGTLTNRKNAVSRFDEWLTENDHNVLDAGPREVQYFLADLSDEGYAPNSIESYLDGVSRLFKYLVEEGLVEENPVEDVDREAIRSLTNGTKKHDEADIVYISEEEKEALVEHAPSPRLRNRLIIRLLWQTGVRVHELVGIELDNIDRAERTIRVFSRKTSDWRTVYFQEDLDFLLDQWIDGGYRDSYGPSDQSPYLFPSQRSEQIDYYTVGKIVREAADEAGIQEVMYEDAAGKKKHRVTPHAIRHGHAVHSLRCGIDVRTIMDHLGHKNIETTMDYLQLIDEEVQKSYQQRFGNRDKDHS